MCFLFQFMVLALVTAAVAAPQNQKDVQILRNDFNNADLDSYSFAWETSDGSKREEEGQLKNKGTDNVGIAVRGQYSWVAPDGVLYTVTYIADENGFQPTIKQGPGGGSVGDTPGKRIGGGYGGRHGGGFGYRLRMRFGGFGHGGGHSPALVASLLG